MSSTTSTSSTSSPPAWSKAGYQQAGQAAQDLYNSGAGGNPYLGSTVAPLSDTTMSGINQLATAGANSNTSASRPLFQGIGAGAGSVYDAAGQPTSAATNLQDMANGTYLQNGNPYFDAALKGQLDNTAAQVQSQFSGSGRYGSAADTGALTNSLGNIRSTALAGQFNQDAQNMLAANGQIDSSNNASRNTQLGALGAGQTAANSIAGLDQNQFNNNITGANATMQAGQALDTQNQNQLTDNVNLYNALDNADWNRLGMYESALSGASGNYGRQTSQSSSSNPMAAIGAGASLLGK